MISASGFPRVGVGYDSHRFVHGRRLILGGVTIPFEQGLAGHSDADALCHAITDALLGAAGLGDIGSHFPPEDPKWRDADSMDLLRRVVGLLATQSLRPVQVDASIICEAPRLEPHRKAMRERLGDALGTGAGGVSIKGKSNEGMGWIGRGEGLAVIAVAVVAPFHG